MIKEYISFFLFVSIVFQVLPQEANRLKNNVLSFDSIQSKSAADSCIKYCQTYLTSKDTSRIDSTDAFFYLYLGKSYFKKEAYKKAIRLFSLADTTAPSYALRDKGEIQYNLSRSHLQLGELQESFSTGMKSLQYYEAINDSVLSAKALILLASVSRKLQNYKDAESYLKKSITLSTSKIYKEGWVIPHINLGNLYAHQDQFQQAIQQYALAKKHHNPTDLEQSFLLLNNIGNVNYDLEQLDSALHYYNDALSISKTSHSKLKEARTQYNIANVYLDQGKYNQAVDSYSISIDLLQKIQEKYILRRAFLYLSEAHEANQNHLQALLAYQKYDSLNNLILSEEKLKHIDALKIQHQTEQKEKENEILKQKEHLQTIEIQQKTNEKNVFLTAFIFVLVIIGLIGYGYYLKTKSAKRLRFANQTKDKLFAIIAHDLRGPMASFQDLGKLMLFYLEKNRIEDLQRMFKQLDQSAFGLNHLLNNLLHWSISNSNSIQTDPQNFRIFDAVEEVSSLFTASLLSKKIQLSIDLNHSDIVFSDYNNTCLILRNLLSNAIKYSPTHGKVILSGKVINSQYYLQIQDSGNGISPKSHKDVFKLSKSVKGTAGEKGTGLGLSLSSTIAKANNAKLHIIDSNMSGTTFELILPTQPETI